MQNMKKTMNNIFGWSIQDEKVVPPNFDFPDCVWERIDFFASQYEDGLTFEGALRFVLAYNEQECIDNYDVGGCDDWLPVTQEFKEWRDSYRDRSMELAVALIYGPSKSEGENDESVE